MPTWTVRATWHEDEEEVTEAWLVRADTAHAAVERASTHARFPPHHVEARRMEPGEAPADLTSEPRRITPRG